MLPHRIVVAALALLLLAQALPIAHAQVGQNTSDLVVDRLVMDDPVVGIQETLTFTVKNVGSDTFSSATGWQLWIGWKVPTNTHPRGQCIDGSEVPDAGECYQRIPSTDGRRTIGPGDSVTIEVDWAPTTTQGKAGVIDIVTVIEGAGCPSTGLTSCQNPQTGTVNGPDGRPQNNVQTHRVFVKAPGVRAVPLRDPADRPGADVNSGWRLQDIKEPCALAPVVTRVGCKAKPDTVIVFEYLVINEGNSGDTFVPTLLDDDDDSTNLTNRKFRWTFQPAEAVISAAHGTKVVRLEVVVPPSERVGNATNVPGIAQGLTARIQWRSLLNPLVTTANPPEPPCDATLKAQGVCQNPSFPSLLIDVARNLNVTTNDTLKQANATVLDVYNLTLNNTGNARDTFKIDIDWNTSAINHSWLPNGDIRQSFPPNVTLEPFTTRNVSIALIPPANATKGKHPFDVVLQSEKDTDGSTLRRVRFDIDLLQRFSLSGYTETPLLRRLPAEPAPFVLNIENKGNGPDNVTLSLVENKPFSWTAALSNSTILVPPHSTVPVYLNVTVPENTPADTPLTSLFVNVTSQGPHDKPPEQRPRHPFQVNMSVLAGSNIRLTSALTSTFIDPGSTHEFDVIVRNTGNARDNFTITAERDQSQLAWSASVTPSFLVLDPTQQGVVRVSLRAPPTATVGETSKVFLTVTSTASKSTSKQLTLDARVSGPDLFVSTIVANSTNPYTGDPLALDIVLGNSGNKAPPRNVTMKVYFIPQNGAQRPIGERTYSAAELPGGRRIAERMIWDTTGIEGSGTLVARIDEANLVAEIDESPAGNEATRAVTLRLFDIRVTPAQGLSGRPGERVAYTEGQHATLVEYRGNQPFEPVTVYVESEHGWVQQGGLVIHLPQGAVIPVLAYVDIPLEPGVARDTLRIRIVPEHRPQAAVTATTITTVLDDEKPRILAVVAEPATAKLGVPVALKADVRDATGLASVRAFVVTPSNETQTYLLQKGEGTTWTFSQTWPTAGAYRFYIEATDGSEAANVNSSRDAIASFVVQPGSAPVITLADGQSTTVRSGTLVRLNITDPLGVARATYSIKGISYDLPRPFSIDTSSFQAGTVELTVTAENVYGVSTSRNFTLVVDNTPPGITSVTLEPARPRANQDVTIRVLTDAKVNAVDVLIKRDGQVVETRAAQKQGSGVFTLLLNPPQGEYTIDVTAKDEAGNTKLSEGAVQFSARPASPFDTPGPGVAIVALAVVGLALVMRRRN